ncbi:MAG TPA: polymer-forming cytoskeletal protein [Burkholderiales bacterium]
MLDNFRKREISQPVQPARSPYSELQEALGTQRAEPARGDSPKIDTPKAASRDDPKASRPSGEPVSRLIVGPDIKLKGAEITDCDTLVVEGRVEASMDSRVIQISEHGVFVGKVGIDLAEIRGRFEGELTARNQLVIRATGKVSGKIRYGTIAIEEGGELSGDIGALAQAQGTQSAKPVPTAATQGAPAARPADTGRTPVPGTAAASAPAQAGGGTLFRPTGAAR